MMTPDKETNIVYGVLCTQLGLASSQDMVPFAQTLADEGGALGETLVSQGVLSREQHLMISEMASDALEAHEGVLARTLATLGGDGVLAQTFGGTLDVSGDGHVRVQRAQAMGEDTFAITLEHPGRYTLGGGRAGEPVSKDDTELGRGGIGRVYVAQDEHVGREVAVKELLPQSSTGQVSLDKEVGRVSLPVVRFLREARVTGQLEHPNIVPVYELGRRRDGTLYYTMKRVRGRTLSDAIEACEAPRDRLSLLNHYADLCHAIAYAHDRGVIHRDLKPENVMVGEFGETVVLDWGLAKIHGKEDLRGEEIERQVELFREADPSQTAAGSMIGTPLYMSPEQARGQVESLDERSDVFSLGVVLFEVLTGTTPFKGGSIFEILYKLASQEAPDPRALSPNVPAELVAICHKALSKDKEARYPNAGALAAEIDAYLTGEKVGAFDYNSWELLKRFARKNTVALAVAAVAFCVLSAVVAISYVQVVVEKNRAVRAEAQATKAREEAEQEKQRAEQLIHYMLTDLRERLEPVGQLEILDGVVGAVQDYYGSSKAKGTLDPASQRNKATAFEVLGEVQRDRGDIKGAEEAFELSLELRQRLVKANPDEGELKLELSTSLTNLGSIHLSRGQVNEARRHYRKALKIRKALVKANPDEGEWQMELARCYDLIAQVQVSKGDSKAAEKSFTKARDILLELTGKDSKNNEWRYELAYSQQRLGDHLDEQGRVSRARKSFKAGMKTITALSKKDPSNSRWQHRRSVLFEKLAEVDLKKGDFGRAETNLRASLEIMVRLTRQDPSNTRWQRDLSATYNKMGDLAVAQKDHETAQERVAKALAIIVRLAASSPDNAAWQRDLSVTHNRHGDILVELKRFEPSGESYRSALDIVTRLSKRDPANNARKHDIYFGYNRLARLAEAQKLKDEALAQHKRALGVIQKLSGRDPANAKWKRDLEETRAALDAIEGGSLGKQRGIRRVQPQKKPRNNQKQPKPSIDRSGIVL